MSHTIIVKGIADKLSFQIPEMNWNEAKDTLFSYVEQNAGFLTGAKVILNPGSHSLKSNDLFEVKNRLADYSISIFAIESADETTRQSARLLGIGLYSPENPHPTQASVSTEPEATGDVLYLQRTIRSGQCIEHPGHVILLGDVNPGGSVLAGGNILVWGKIKGEVHAGSGGDPTCIITALELSPSKLSIAGVNLSNPPRKPGKHAEFAQIVGNTVKIEPWKI